jgi:hypothetical protein
MIIHFTNKMITSFIIQFFIGSFRTYQILILTQFNKMKILIEIGNLKRNEEHLNCHPTNGS